MKRSKLIDIVISQIKVDVRAHDDESIKKMLKNVDTKTLIDYLPEEENDNISSDIIDNFSN